MINFDLKNNKLFTNRPVIYKKKTLKIERVSFYLSTQYVN